MSVIHNDLLLSTDEATGYNLTKSLRFRNSATAYLSRTAGTPTNNLKWTWSAWVKRGTLSATGSMFSGSAGSGNDVSVIYLHPGNDLYFYTAIGSVSKADVRTSALFRDPSAWYHIVSAYDSANATAADRSNFYVNGVRQTLAAGSVNVGLNEVPYINKASTSQILGQNNSSNYFDGYMADVNFIDGQALTASSFGETDATTGVWKPKRFSGTYGTNGFYLPFTDVATTSGSNAGLGKDFSGNGNYWNTNNISVTSGATYDSMKDVPTLTDANTANYCVMNPLDNASGLTITNANLTTSRATASWASTRSTFGMTTGKWYWEVTPTSGIVAGSLTNQIMIGLSKSDATSGGFYQSATGWGYYFYDGNKFNNNSGSAYGATYANNDVIGVAFDADNGTLTFYKNNTSQGTAYTGLTSGPYFAAVGHYGTSEAAINFGQRPFAYTPPTGFVALNTYNLPDSTIVAGNAHFDTTLYTGNGSTQSVTNAGGFSPGLVWLKHRNPAVAAYNLLYDKIRGATKWLSSNVTTAESTIASSLTAFNSNGFSVGADPSGGDTGWNPSSGSMVAWQWKADGTGSTNTSGSITSTVSVNASAGFSIVSYAGNSTAGATVGHGLGVAPKFMIFRLRNTTSNWIVYHQTLGNANTLNLNTTGASASSSAFNSTSPTSTLVTLGGASTGTNDTGYNFIAYCWSEIDGYSKFGSYSGNGSTDGTFIYTGFKPKWLLIKTTNATNSWIIVDSSRNTYNVIGSYLIANNADPEGSATVIDFVSNGIKMRNSYNGWNASGETFVYAAFAENPFKNSLAR